MSVDFYCYMHIHWNFLLYFYWKTHEDMIGLHEKHLWYKTFVCHVAQADRCIVCSSSVHQFTTVGEQRSPCVMVYSLARIDICIWFTLRLLWRNTKCVLYSDIDIVFGMVHCSADGYNGMFTSFRADSRFAPNQWETWLQSNAVSHWLGAYLESALKLCTAPCLHLKSINVVLQLNLVGIVLQWMHVPNLNSMKWDVCRKMSRNQIVTKKDRGDNFNFLQKWQKSKVKYVYWE